MMVASCTSSASYLLFKTKEDVSTILFDKRKKVKTQGTGRRQVLSNLNRQDVMTNNDVASTEDCGKAEFAKDEVMALHNKRAKAGNFDIKAKMEQMTDIIKKLKVCVRWHMQVDETHIQEKENHCSSLEAAEKICINIAGSKEKEEELLASIAEMKENLVSIQEKFFKEELSKLDAIENHKKEKECRVAAEKLQVSLWEEFDKVKEEKRAAKHKVTSIDDMYKRLQEYNTSLQLYNLTPN